MVSERTSLPGPPDPGALKILVVEDDSAVGDALTLFLRLAGHRVQLARTPAAALEAAAAGRPDVALVDLGLPDMDGCELATHFRRREELRQVVLIALTGQGDEASRRATAAAGFALHLVKPVDPDELHRLLAATGGPHSLSPGRGPICDSRSPDAGL
jgi:DNA-binding response OmpR family regulator